MNVAATICEEVHLYGFWPYPVEMRGESVRAVNYHYFNNLPFVTNYHNVDLEFRILLQLHMLGVAKLHTGSCLPDENPHIDANDVKKMLEILDSKK